MPEEGMWSSGYLLIAKKCAWALGGQREGSELNMCIPLCFQLKCNMLALCVFWFLLWSHVVGAPKKQLEPAERLWVQLQKDSKETKKKAGKKLGNRLTKLNKENKLPASDVSELLQAADEAGLEFSNPVPKKRKFEPGKAPELGEAEPEEGCRDKNAARSLGRFLRKNHTWKDLYWAKIPMKIPRKKQMIWRKSGCHSCCLMSGSQIISFKAVFGRKACLKKAVFWPAGWPKLVKALGNPLEICFLWVCMVMECLCKAE